jgi:beta-galactosidase
VIVPVLYMLRDDIAERLHSFVQAGGTVVATHTTGIVDETDLCFLADAPGPLRSLFGIWREEQDALHDGQKGLLRPVEGNALGLSGQYHYYHDADLIHAEGAEVLANYGTDFYQGQPALTLNRYGDGQAYYIASRNDDAFLRDFYGALIRHLALDPVLTDELPEGVTAQVRQDETADYVFLMNFSPEARTVDSGVESFADVLTGTACGDALTVEGYGIRILSRARAAIEGSPQRGDPIEKRSAK